jgi:hypothetical protein
MLLDKLQEQQLTVYMVQHIVIQWYFNCNFIKTIHFQLI